MSVMQINASGQSIYDLGVEIPIEYFDEFDQQVEQYTPLIQITSNDLNKVLKEIKAYYIGNKGPSPTPFLGCTIDQVYDFHRTSLRPADNSTAHEHFTCYTFIVVDAEDVRSNPWKCIFCCDAPDFGEADEEIRFKRVRMAIKEAMQYLCALEHLTMTPSKVENPGGWEVSMMPPPNLVRVNEEAETELRGRIATPAESRRNKRRGVRTPEETDAKGDSQRELITLRDVLAEEFLKAGTLARAAEQEVRKRGHTIVLRDIWTRKV